MCLQVLLLDIYGFVVGLWSPSLRIRTFWCWRVPLQYELGQEKVENQIKSFKEYSKLHQIWPKNRKIKKRLKARPIRVEIEKWVEIMEMGKKEPTKFKEWSKGVIMG